ncbi:MAG: hypothetical protein GXP63_03560 [DPANN group archaeon]|nr:hypothetical protein [DPANN group archaeon]
MLHLSTLLQYYKRPEIQNAIVDASMGREVGLRYGDRAFGKRPDVLLYPADVLESVKKGATSFHVSEERWQNPLLLSPAMSRKELDVLRVGWDLVIDVDFELWEGTCIISDAIVRALRSHGIRSITAKFSGNKGFHISVPFEAFPEKYHDVETKDLFPEEVKRIVEYLTHYIDSPDNDYAVSRQIISLDAFKRLQKADPEKARRLVAETVHDTPTKIDLKIDTILVSSRHMYRSVYSLHEKSGLASVPVDPDNILAFERSSAEPSKVKVGVFPWLDTSKATPDEARGLFLQAADFRPKIEQEASKKDFAYEDIKDAIPEELFPPCIHNIFKGIKDGKKRAIFILINFLSSSGWSYDKIEERLMGWNKGLDEPLREVNIKGSIRYHRQQAKRKLPPNCDNMMYYRDFGVCTPDNLCNYIKNPVQYVRRKTKYMKDHPPRKKRVLKKAKTDARAETKGEKSP